MSTWDDRSENRFMWCWHLSLSPKRTVSFSLVSDGLRLWAFNAMRESVCAGQKDPVFFPMKWLLLNLGLIFIFSASSISDEPAMEFQDVVGDEYSGGISCSRFFRVGSSPPKRYKMQWFVAVNNHLYFFHSQSWWFNHLMLLISLPDCGSQPIKRLVFNPLASSSQFLIFLEIYFPV